MAVPGVVPAPPVTLMSATMSFSHVGMVLIAFQISFFSASVATVPLKWSLPSCSSALPWNLPLAVWMAYAYVSLKPMCVLQFAEISVTPIDDLAATSRT